MLTPNRKMSPQHRKGNELAVEPRFTDTPSLRQYILLLAEDEVNPSVIAGKILAEALTYGELRVIAEATLRGWAWEQMKRASVVSVENAGDLITPAFSDTPRKTKAEVRTFVNPRGGRGPSWRLRDFAYAQELRKPVKVGKADGDKKRLGECTITDLAYMAQCRRTMAAANLAEAAKYTTLADALKKADVDTVADLPREVGQKILLN